MLAGVTQGLGRLDMAGGASYEGEFQLGKFQGNGVYCSLSGMKYEVCVCVCVHRLYIHVNGWQRCTKF